MVLLRTRLHRGRSGLLSAVGPWLKAVHRGLVPWQFRPITEVCTTGSGSPRKFYWQRNPGSGNGKAGWSLLKWQVTVGAFRWAHTRVLQQAMPPDSCSALGAASLPPRKGGREPARRPALYGAKRGGAPSLGVCAS